MTIHTTHTGIHYTIRFPTEDDAQGILDFAKLLFASTDQVLTTLEEYTLTLEQEKQWIRHGNEDSNTLILIAEVQNKVIALLDFNPKPKVKTSHTGEFGVSVHPEFQGNGIGKKMIQRMLQWATENPQIEKVMLSVFETNPLAIGLYKSLGFREEGRLVKAVKQPNGTYVDVLQMYLFV